MGTDNNNRKIIAISKLPDLYPTYEHSSEFWEHLGRTVATFGFLEQVLGRAIFALTGTKPYSDSEIEKAYEEWEAILEKALSDTLGNLIVTYQNAANNHPDFAAENFEKFIEDLREAAQIRNVLCHGSWGPPDESGSSTPFFVNRKKGVANISFDIAFLKRVQRHTAKLACQVINTIMYMGLQFPGSAGPGQPVWSNGE